MAAFNECWECDEMENTDAYCDAIAAPDDIRTLIKSKHSIKMSNDGDTWTYVSTMLGKENIITLTVGVIGEYKTPNGTPLKGIIKSASDNKIVEEHFMGDYKVDTVREIINGQNITTFTVNGVSAKMIYNKK